MKTVRMKDPPILEQEPAKHSSPELHEKSFDFEILGEKHNELIFGFSKTSKWTFLLYSLYLLTSLNEYKSDLLLSMNESIHTAF